MILYFNDYKLIYIITMMGKINNIPVLNEDVIRLVVGKSSVSCPLKPSDSAPLKHSTMPP